jgi:hypothetical protein
MNRLAFACALGLSLPVSSFAAGAGASLNGHSPKDIGIKAPAIRYAIVDLTQLDGWPADVEWSAVYAISNTGIIVGQIHFTNGSDRGFRIANGTLELLEPPSGFSHSVAYDVNDTGVVAGDAHGGPNENSRACIWPADSNVATLLAVNSIMGEAGTIYGNSHATCISPTGVVAGNADFVYENDRTSRIEEYEGGPPPSGGTLVNTIDTVLGPSFRNQGALWTSSTGEPVKLLSLPDGNDIVLHSGPIVNADPENPNAYTILSGTHDNTEGAAEAEDRVDVIAFTPEGEILGTSFDQPFINDEPSHAVKWPVAGGVAQMVDHKEIYNVSDAGRLLVDSTNGRGVFFDDQLTVLSYGEYRAINDRTIAQAPASQVVGRAADVHGNNYAALWEWNSNSGSYDSFDINQLIRKNSGWFLSAANDINNDGIIVADGSYQPRDPEGNPSGPPISKPVALVQIIVDRAWSNQLAGVEANWMPDGTGNANKPYIFMGCRADGNAYAAAKLTSSIPQYLQGIIYFRLARQDSSTYIPAAGTSTLNVQDNVVLLSADNPEAADHVLVCGTDNNGDDQLSPDEVSLIPECLHDPPGGGVDPVRMPFTFKVVNQPRYTESLNTITSQADGYISGVITPQGGRLLKAFATNTDPSGATSASTEIGRLEPGLTHPVGIVFQPISQPGASVEIEFSDSDDLTDLFLSSIALNQFLSNFLESKRSEVETWFNDPENQGQVSHHFAWITDGTASFPFAATQDLDLAVALGRVKIANVNVQILVNRFALTVEEVLLFGAAGDLYDFDYDSDTWYFTLVGIFPSKAAEVQVGYPTLGVGGKVYRSKIVLNGAQPYGFQFKYQP